jgi:hypothetical protein
VEMIDMMRNHPREALAKFFPPGANGEAANMPAGVKALTVLFMPPDNGKSQNGAVRATASAVMRVLGIK